MKSNTNEVEKLAKRFSIDVVSAREYFTDVRHRCRPYSPRNSTIVKIILNGKSNTLPNPEKIAKKIKREASNTEYWEKRQKLGYAKLYDIKRTETSTGREPGVVSHNRLDDERVAPDKLHHCPHGVPEGTLCAICDPDEFKFMVGTE